LEFPDGQIVLPNLLEEGQHATVLQLRAEQLPAAAVGTKTTQQAARLAAELCANKNVRESTYRVVWQRGHELGAKFVSVVRISSLGQKSR
jgi:hypothetical protein